VGISTAIRRFGRAKLGERSARAQGWPRGSCLDPHETFVVERIEAQKNVPLNEMVVRLANEVGLQIGRSALSIWLGRRGWTFKTRPHVH
jgi:transposase